MSTVPVVAGLLLAVAGGLVFITWAVARGVERAVPSRGRFLEIDGDRIHYEDSGDGPPLVFIHGLGGQLGNFAYGLRDRLNHRFRVVLIDRPGAGHSTRRREAMTLGAHAATIAGLIRTLDLERPVVVGHSLGGAIALALGLDAPDLVRRLALVAPLIMSRDKVPPPFGLLAIRSPLLRRITAWTVATPLAILGRRLIISTLFGPNRPPADFAVKGGGLLTLRPSQFCAASADLVATAADMPTLQTRYSRLPVPVFALFASRDRVLDAREQSEGLRQALPASRLELVDAGHMLPVTHPDLVAAWITSVVDDSPVEVTRRRAGRGANREV